MFYQVGLDSMAVGVGPTPLNRGYRLLTGPWARLLKPLVGDLVGDPRPQAPLPDPNPSPSSHPSPPQSPSPPKPPPAGVPTAGEPPPRKRTVELWNAFVDGASEGLRNETPHYMGTFVAGFVTGAFILVVAGAIACAHYLFGLPWPVYDSPFVLSAAGATSGGGLLIGLRAWNSKRKER